MRKQGIFFACAGCIFVGTFLYLHQKVQIYVEAYRLSKNYQIYNECVDKRDHLMYNFMKEVSLPRLNAWVDKNEFSPVQKGRMLALNRGSKKAPVSKHTFASLLRKAAGFSSGSSTVLAQERSQ